jgi:23S rRNA (guanosine2251-2'-O)-methyltransferase
VAVHEELIYGWHAVLAALERSPERVLQVWLDEKRSGPKPDAVLKAARAGQIKLQRAGRAQLEELVGEAHHQGVVARCRVATPSQVADLGGFLAGLTQPPFLLVLDGVQDPHNLGACLRTADAAGVHALILPRDNAVSVTPTVRKVASGAAETVPVFQVTNLARTLDQLKADGVWLVGASGDAQDSLYDQDLRGPLALVLGAEGKGLRRLTQERCDFLVHIPMVGSVSSLNVSVATGICLFEALRQRRAAPPASQR